MDVISFFTSPTNIAHKQYEALRAVCYDQKPCSEVAKQFGYTVSALYSLVRDFKSNLRNYGSDKNGGGGVGSGSGGSSGHSGHNNHHNNPYAQFFIEPKAAGRKQRLDHDELKEKIVLLRKKYKSIAEIKTILDATNISASEKHIYNILHAEGFARLPKRSKEERNLPEPLTIDAPKTCLLENKVEQFNTQNAAIMCFLPYIKSYGIDELIKHSDYPETTTLPRLNSILAFTALKLSNVRRYSSDDLWCMDRGMGLFAGLNVLPKASWFTSYSHRVTREMNLAFLKDMNQLWIKTGLLSDTTNLDFVAVPYYGEDDHLENNWSGTRHQALTSVLAAIAHDPDSGIITYGDANVKHDNESDIALEFLDFYKQSEIGTSKSKNANADINTNLKYLVFDSKFTTYENLGKLNANDVKFITIRRRGKNIINDLESLDAKDWKTIRVPASNNKTRLLKIHEQEITLQGYSNGDSKRKNKCNSDTDTTTNTNTNTNANITNDKDRKDKVVRQIAITGHGKVKPALIITNDFEINTVDVVRKYAKRWLVEKTISEQTHFFHLNKLSSSMVIKVDFDLTMTILAHNLYRLLAQDLPGYSHNTSQALYEKFIYNSGMVEITNKTATIKLKKKRNLPLILSIMNEKLPEKIDWLNDHNLVIEAATFS